VTEKLLTGNEAIASGAENSFVSVMVGYPGTPSTEIIENVAARDNSDIYAEWAPNEKVALEVAIGAALSGVRAMATMKHVGVNVAADPLMTATYMGVRGGLVIVTADDPGMHSSQNEQDNRNYAKFARVPMLEPSDSQEAHDMVGRSLDISETFDTPVFLRCTTRVSHSKSLVKETILSRPGARRGFERNPQKLVMIPANARGRHPKVQKRLRALQEFADEADYLNRIEWGNDRSVGIITGGIAYQYVREVRPEASVLKLGLSYPLPMKMIREFADAVDELFVVEELDPFWETEIRAAGIQVNGKECFPITGELSPSLVRTGLGEPIQTQHPDGPDEVEVPVRPPVLCPGCPHRGVFAVLSELGLIVTGDIGCYSLGVMPPLSAMDTLTCMGASIGQAMGMEKALGDDAPDTVAVIGDSTFMHSGMTALTDVVYNDGHVTTIILDNHATAMTGHQAHPGAGLAAQQKGGRRADLEKLVRGLGVDDVARVDPYDLDEVKQAVRSAGQNNAASVIIAERPCVLLDRALPGHRFSVGDDCTGCGICLRIGCPALSRTDAGTVQIDTVLCTHCGMCAQVCDFDAIERRDESS